MSFALLLSFKHSLCILDTMPQYMHFVKIFSKSVVCLFILLNSVFHRAEVLNFNEAQLISFSFQGLYFFVVLSKKSSPNPSSPGFSPMVPSRSIIF